MSVCSPPNFNLKQVAPKTVTTGFLAHLLLLLVEHREDIITGKPEASLKCFLDKVKNNLSKVLKQTIVKKGEKLTFILMHNSQYATIINYQTDLHIVGFGVMAKGHFQACAVSHFWALLLPATVVEVTITICFKFLFCNGSKMLGPSYPQMSLRTLQKFFELQRLLPMND